VRFYAAAIGVDLLCPVEDRRKAESRLHVTGEGISWHEFFQRDGDRLVTAAGLRGAERQAGRRHDRNQTTLRVS
jgi:hypothetical protein